MQKYIEILKQSPLFEGMKGEETEGLLFSLNPKIKKYKKGVFIIMAGAPVREFGIVLSGSVLVIKEDMRGLRSIIAQCGPSEMFAEALACAQVERSPVSVVVDENAEIMFINFESVMRAGQRAARLIKNMLMLLARKNIFLNSKLEHVSKRNIREKLLSYLMEQRRRAGRAEFEIPLTQTDLADFLFIDRSAMARELAKMRSERLVTFTGRKFAIKNIKGGKYE